MLIADTGPLVAMLNAKDKHHQACTTLFRRVRGPIIVPAPMPQRGQPLEAPMPWARAAIRCGAFPFLPFAPRTVLPSIAITSLPPAITVLVARGAHRRPDDRHAGRGEHRVERRGELGVPVPDQELEAFGMIVEVHQQVAALPGHPLPVG
jgi:hypothetical protein